MALPVAPLDCGKDFPEFSETLSGGIYRLGSTGFGETTKPKPKPLSQYPDLKYQHVFVDEHRGSSLRIWSNIIKRRGGKNIYRGWVMPTENQGMDIHHPSTLVPPEIFDLEPKISQGKSKSCLRCISTANVLGSKSTCPVSMVSQSSLDKAGSSLLMILMFIRGMKAMQGPKSPKTSWEIIIQSTINGEWLVCSFKFGHIHQWQTLSLTLTCFSLAILSLTWRIHRLSRLNAVNVLHNYIYVCMYVYVYIYIHTWSYLYILMLYYSRWGWSMTSLTICPQLDVQPAKDFDEDLSRSADPQIGCFKHSHTLISSGWWF